MAREWHEVFRLTEIGQGFFEVKLPYRNDVLFAAAGYGLCWNGRVQVSANQSAQSHKRELLGGTLYTGEHRLISVDGFRLFRFLLLRLDIAQPPAFPGEGPVPTSEELWEEARQPPPEAEAVTELVVAADVMLAPEQDSG